MTHTKSTAQIWKAIPEYEQMGNICNKRLRIGTVLSEGVFDVSRHKVDMVL